MAFKVTINGVDKTGYVKYKPEPRITKKQNERSTASLTLAPGYVPSQFDPIVIYDVDGTTAVFAGLVTQASTAGIEPGASAHNTSLQCVDAMWYTDVAYWTKTYSAPVTLKQILTDVIADKLTTYGITLDAAQDTGDTFPAFTVTRIKVSDLLRNLATSCSPVRVARMSATKALRILVPGTDVAPVAISNAAPNCHSFEWTHSSFTPANYVELICGPTGTGTPVQAWTVAASPLTWEVDIQCVVGGWNAGVVIEKGTPDVSRTLSAPGGGGYYYFDPTVGKGTISIGTGVRPPNGTVLNFNYTAIYPFTVFATSGASPVIEQQFVDEAQLLLAPAQLEVNGLLAKLNQAGLRDVTIVTFVTGFMPSQALTCTLTSREFSAATLGISQVDAVFTEFQDPGHFWTSGPTVRLWRYTIAATETLAYQGSYLDQARQLFAGGGSGATVLGSSGGGGGTIVVPATPVYMGGSYVQSVTNPSGSPRGSLIQNAVPYVAKATFTGRLRVNLKARDAGVGVQAIITDLTTDVATSIVTSQTFTDTSVVVPIVTGHTYWVYIKNNATGDGYVGYAQLEAA